MKFVKTIRIRDKMFSRDDIVVLWRFVARQPEVLHSGETTVCIENEGGEVSASSDEVFDTNNFTKKPIKSIHIQYRSAGWSSEIDITIAVEASYLFARSGVRICGESESWVDSCSERIRDLLSDVHRASVMTLIIHRGGAYAVGGVVILTMWPVFMSLIVPGIKAYTDIVPLRFAMALVYLGLVGWLYFQVMKLDRFFPVVDIDIGGDHILNRQRIARVLLWIVSAVILPFVIGVCINRWDKGENRGENFMMDNVTRTNAVLGVQGPSSR